LKKENLFPEKSDIREDIRKVLLSPITPRKIFDLWNRLSEEVGVTRCSFLSDSLSRKLKKLISIFSSKQWEEFFSEVLENEFLQNVNWFGLSWISVPENFAKVVDGVYKRSKYKPDKPSNALGKREDVIKMLDEWRREDDNEMS